MAAATAEVRAEGGALAAEAAAPPCAWRGSPAFISPPAFPAPLPPLEEDLARFRRPRGDATSSPLSAIPAGAPARTTTVATLGLGVFLLSLLAGVVSEPVWGAQLALGSPASVLDFSGVWAKAAGSAAKGGLAGLLAGVLQVLSFMWLRTSMNYQYVNGGTLQSALSELWSKGGIQRLYQGVSLAIIQAPLSRFGDTAANAGVLVLMDFYLPGTPLALKTAAASTAAAFWRLLLTPIDTLKTVRQVRGDEAMEVLMDRVKLRGFTELYAGAIANFAANWVGNYPYFVVFNALSEAWAAPDDAMLRVVRNGVLGMCSSISSDVASNSLRVLKTLRQSTTDPELGYVEAAQRVMEKDGLLGLLGRGLETRLLVNVLQGTFFTIVWKLIEEALNK